MDEDVNTPPDGTTKKHKPIAPHVAARRRSRQIAIAAVIRNARRARHMVQEELAEQSGISKGHIGRLESTQGATTYDLTLLRMWDILDALGMTWAEWERDVKFAMAGGVQHPPSKRDEDVALLARVVRTLPDDMVSILLDLARTLERHQTGLMNTPPSVDANWVREAEDAARRVGMETIDEALGIKEKERKSRQDRARDA
jgi:transcriptional regulator with XRE-family HTH domain